MYDFNINLICVGFSDDFLDSLDIEGLSVFRKGDIWRKRTGETYNANIAKLSLEVSETEGYEEGLNRLMEMIDRDSSLSNLLSNSDDIEIQLSASLDDDNRMPHMHLSARQLKYFSGINAELDIHIS